MARPSTRATCTRKVTTNVVTATVMKTSGTPISLSATDRTAPGSSTMGARRRMTSHAIAPTRPVNATSSAHASQLRPRLAASTATQPTSTMASNQTATRIGTTQRSVAVVVGA